MVKTVKKMSTGNTANMLVQAVSFIRYQKQVANLERIARIMLRDHDMDAIVMEKELNRAVKDGVIETYVAVSHKGTNVGMEQEAYRIPGAGISSPTPGPRKSVEASTTPKLKRKSKEKASPAPVKKTRIHHEKSDHDWYCFECQKTELLIHCAECWRSWHSDCTDIDVTNPETFVCAVCLDVAMDMKKKSDLSKKYLNMLLGYALLRLKDKARELYHLPPKDYTEEWEDIVYHPMDLSLIEEKTQARKYTCSEQFVADTKTVTHDISLVCGASHPLVQLSVTMLNDCMYEIDEIRQCHNCYYMSNLKPPDWFCQPCDPPHELVYAKQTGFSFWPAKVIYELDGDKCDVRFFGGYHQRAIVPSRNIKPITTNIQEIAAKRTGGFNKACGELEKHKLLLSGEKSSSKYVFSESESETEIETDDNKTDDYKIDETETLRVVSSSSPAKADDVKSPLCEDGNQVTSSEDNVVNIASKKRKIIETATTHTQTKDTKLATKTSQTDKKMNDSLCDCGPTCHRTDEKEKPAPPLEKVSTHDIPLPGEHPGSGDRVAEKKEEKPAKPDVKTEAIEREKALAELRQKLQKDFEEDKQQAIARAMANMQRELERTRKQTEDKCAESHAEELKKIQSKHKEVVSVIKHKQWCYNCELEAMYHCCWNTSYCSIKCQQEHWHKEHKRVCRRKR